MHQCAASPMSPTALNYRAAKCTVIDHCEEGKCPQPSAAMDVSFRISDLIAQYFPDGRTASLG
jgi:hypothetical protein